MGYSTKACIIFLLGFVFLAADSATSSPLAPTHDEAACGPCHLAAATSSEAFSTPASNQCLTCHQSSQISRGQFHSSAQGRCVECHAFHEPWRITLAKGGASLALDGKDEDGHCQSCHDPRGVLATLSSAHQVAAGLYHTEADQLENVSPSEACLRCHANSSNSNWQSAPDEEIMAFNTHASHPYSVRVIPGQGNGNNGIRPDIDPRLPLFGDVMECQTCHLLTANNDDLMIPFETKYDLCNGCHQHQGNEGLAKDKLMATMVRR